MYVRNFTGYYGDKTCPRSRYSLQFYKNNVSFRALFSIAGSVPTSLKSRHILREQVPRKKNLISQPKWRLATLRVELELAAATRETLGQIGEIAIYGTPSPLNSFKLDIDDGTVKGAHVHPESFALPCQPHTRDFIYNGCVHHPPGWT